MTLPTGMTERRTDQDPWAAPPLSRPRRISDDLSWLRGAMDEPEASGLRELKGTAAVAVWAAAEEDPEPRGRLLRLDERGVLGAAGFLLGMPDNADSD
jgi:hypothetical protein